MAFDRINITLDKDYHAVFKDEVGGDGHVSEAFRILEEEFVLGDESERNLSIRSRAKLAADRARKRILAQKKITQDEESFKQRTAREIQERQDLINSETRAAIRRLGFRKEMILDDQHFTWQRKRDELADAVSDACRLDLQWKDIEQAVKVAVKT